VTELEPTSRSNGPDHHVLVQAPIAPVDVDGVMAAQVGTVTFLVLTAVCWWWLPTLSARGDGWWLWVCLVGAALGVVMVMFTRWRRTKAATASPQGQLNSSSSTEIESQTGSGR